jgi:hypothetical protein
MQGKAIRPAAAYPAAGQHLNELDPEFVILNTKPAPQCLGIL